MRLRGARSYELGLVRFGRRANVGLEVGQAHAVVTCLGKGMVSSRERGESEVSVGTRFG